MSETAEVLTFKERTESRAKRKVNYEGIVSVHAVACRYLFYNVTDQLCRLVAAARIRRTLLGNLEPCLRNSKNPLLYDYM